jgi:DNA-binding response OmpR family regulator
VIVACYDDGRLYVDFDKQRMAIEGKTVHLRPRDYDVLIVLISHQGEALSPEQLIDLAAWDDRSWLARDRMKYALARLKHDLGSTRGVGYRFRSPSV